MKYDKTVKIRLTEEELTTLRELSDGNVSEYIRSKLFGGEIANSIKKPWVDPFAPKEDVIIRYD
jgi:hypothetical protein